MFTFCFTSVAVANLRRAVKTQKSARKTGVVRVVRRGLASVAIVMAAAGFAQAGGGGHGGGHSGGSGFSGGSGGSTGRSIGNLGNIASVGNVGNKVATHTTVSNLGPTNNTLKLNTSKPITLNNVGNVANHPDVKINNPVVNSLKNDKGLTLNHVSEVKQHLDIHSSVSKIFSSKVKFCDHPHKCSFWYCWHYPTWSPLYSCGCGYYYDVPVVEIPVGLDLQLLAVRIVDSGDPENQQGPAVRVWFRNNSAVAIEHPFNVIAVAARDVQATPDLPQAGVRIDRIDASQTLSVDIRLPIQANDPAFPMLHVVVDSHREILEVNEANNGLVINRGEVLPLEASELQGPASAVAAGQAAPIATQNAKVAPVGPASVNGLPNDAPVNGPVAPPVAKGAASVEIELPTATSDESSFNIVKN
jgi:hypothetical protein